MRPLCLNSVRNAFLILLLALFINAQSGAQNYTYQIVAQTGQAVGTNRVLTAIDRYPSINDNGYVAFIGSVATGATAPAQNIFVYNGTSDLLYPLMASSLEVPQTGAIPTQNFVAPKINNKNVVLARRQLNPSVLIQEKIYHPFPIGYTYDSVTLNGSLTYLETWDATKANSATASLLNATGDFELAKNINSLNVFPVTLIGSPTWNPSTGYLLPSSFNYAPPYPIWDVIQPSGTQSFPTINNFGSIVFTAQNASPDKQAGNYLATLFSSVAQSYKTTAATHPRIADTADIVFQDQNQIMIVKTGLVAPTVIAGSPMFTSVGKSPAISSNGQTIVFYGELAAGQTVMGGSGGKGIYAAVRTGTSPNFTWNLVQLAGVGASFSGFYPDEYLGVNNVGNIVFLANDNTGNKGIFYTGIINAGGQLSHSVALIVSNTGNDPNFGAVTDLSLYDPINNTGQINFWLQTADGNQKIVSANAKATSYLAITAARMRLGEELEVKVIRNFGAALPDVKFTITVGGNNYEHIEPSTYATTLPVAVALNLKDMGVPRFNANTKISIKVTAVVNNATVTDAHNMVVLLPVILIPGINPLAFHDGNDMGGDGTFPAMEAALKSKSNTLFQTGSLLGEGYYTQLDRTDPTDPTIYRDYPTVYTLSYNRNNASFAEGAQVLQTLIDSIKANTYADTVNIATHSKGGLVARAYLSAAFDKTGATVKQLIMTEPPNLGSLWARLDYLSAYGSAFGLVSSGYNYSNLYPIYSWWRYYPFQKYIKSLTNTELINLNKQPLPNKVMYTIIVGNGNLPAITGTPLDFTELTYRASPGISGLYPATNFTDGDGIVPTFSQLGLMFDPNNPTGPMPLIPAFQGIQINTITIAGSHIGFFNQQAVEQEIFAEFTSDLK